MLICVSNKQSNLLESFNTLNFGQRASTVQNKPRKNVVEQQHDIYKDMYKNICKSELKLKEEVSQLQKRNYLIENALIECLQYIKVQDKELIMQNPFFSDKKSKYMDLFSNSDCNDNNDFENQTKIKNISKPTSNRRISL